MHLWKQRLQEWIVLSVHTPCGSSRFMVRVCMVGSPGGRHATTCMRRLQDNFMELVLPSAFTWVPGLNLYPQPCTESSFTTKPSCWPLQSFSKAMLQYCYTGKWSLKLVQSTFDPQPSRLSLIHGCVAWILLLNECVLLLEYCWFGTFLCISLDNSSIFQAFACDKCSQLYKKLSGSYLLSLSSQGASSESSITLLAFVLLEFLFGELPACSSCEAPRAKKDASMLNEQETLR